MMGRLNSQKNFTPLLDQCLENIDLCKSIRIKIAGEENIENYLNQIS